MGLNKGKLGEYLYWSDSRNADNSLGADSVRGIATAKAFIPTKAKLDGVSLTNYKKVEPHQFAYVPDTSRRGDKISLAFNDSEDTYLVSSISAVFGVKPDVDLLPEFLFLFFNRPEFDRYARFNSWGSAREAFSWDEMCDIDIELPDLTIQQKYVDIYRGMQENLDAMNRGVEESKRSYEILLDRAVHSSDKHPIGDYIEETDVRNSDLRFGQSDVKGMTITKEIIPTKANTAKAEVGNYKIVYPNEFVYNPRTHGKKIGLGFNYTNEPFIISWNNSSFKIKDNRSDDILPEYLYLCFCRSEWDREACFQSWGSSTEVFSWNALCGIEVGVPDMSEQTAIVEIYNAVRERMLLINRLSALQKTLCPVLIRGAIEEGGRS